MINTFELRILVRTVPDHRTHETEAALQQKWVAEQLPEGATELPFEWRDVPTVREAT